MCASLFAHLLFCSLSSSLPRPHHSPVAARHYSALWPSSLLFGAWSLRHSATRQLGNSVAAAFGQLGDCWLLRPGAHPLWHLVIALLPWHFAISSLCYPSGWPLWCFAPPVFLAVQVFNVSMCSTALVVGALFCSATLVRGGFSDRPLRRSGMPAPILGPVLPKVTPTLGHCVC